MCTTDNKMKTRWRLSLVLGVPALCRLRYQKRVKEPCCFGFFQPEGAFQFTQKLKDTNKNMGIRQHQTLSWVNRN